jgi:hypothetical protein
MSTSETPKLDELWETMLNFTEGELRKFPQLYGRLRESRLHFNAKTAIIVVAVIAVLIAVEVLSHTTVTAIACVYPFYRTIMVRFSLCRPSERTIWTIDFGGLPSGCCLEALRTSIPCSDFC